MTALACAVPGILCGLAFPVDALWPLLGALGTLVPGCLLWRSKFSLWFIWPALFFIAWAHGAQQVRPPSPRVLSALMERPREYVQLQGRVVDDPILLKNHTSLTSDTWRMTINVQEINRRGYFEVSRGKVDLWLHISDPAIAPAYGDVWQVEGVLHHRESRGWTWSWLPAYRLTARSETTERMATGHGSAIKRFSFAARRAAATQLGKGLEQYPETAGILRALLLGYRHELPETHHRLFAATGTLHVFAISGLHLAIFGGLVLLVVRAFGVPMNRTILWVGPLLILYAIVTGLRPSALRACTMALSFGSAYLFNRRPDAPSAWALAALGILSFDPAQLTAPGFLFSFVVVAGLIRLYPVIANNFKRSDTWQHEVDQVARPSFLINCGIWIFGLAVASLSAWVASAPLTAQYFNLFSPIALIGNMLVIPAAFVIVLTGLLSLTFGVFSTLFAEVFNHTNRLIIDTLVGWIDLLERIPYAYRYIRSPGSTIVLMFYALLFWGTVKAPPQWRKWGYTLLLAVLLTIAYAHYLYPVTRVYVFDAGNGHATLVQSPGATVLYDAGPAYRADRLVRSLRSKGVNRLDALILSTAVAPHAGGAIPVMKEIPLDSVWITEFSSRSPVYNQAISHAYAEGIPVYTRKAGDAGMWACGTGWEILHPPKEAPYRRAADAAMVLRVHRGVRSILLTGGGGGPVEDLLLASAREVSATAWIIGNQGRDGVGSGAGFSAIRPEAVVLATGAYSRYGDPTADALDRLGGNAGIPLWRTDAMGTIEIRLHSTTRMGRQVDHWSIRSERAGPEP